MIQINPQRLIILHPTQYSNSVHNLHRDVATGVHVMGSAPSEIFRDPEQYPHCKYYFQHFVLQFGVDKRMFEIMHLIFPNLKSLGII